MDNGQNSPLDISSQADVLIVKFRQTSIEGLSGVEQTADKLRALISDARPRKLVMDFSQVRFFSSQTLGLLVDIWRRMKECGGALTISGIDPQLTRVFRITHLDKLFEFYDSAESAVASLTVV
ncbi:MAG: STAS domain-containing protein [Planctomycetaceae bacterium]|nr:STAS domain-containing protein [Planctomycetaceae bacterium]